MGNYATEAEVRAEGATATSARINARIEKWEAIVEKVTGNYFRVLAPGELIFDGNNMTTLFFSLALVAVTSVKINGETVALTADEYRTFAGRVPPADDRYNPKIQLTPTGIISTIFRPEPAIFLKGYDQRITATWGFVDDDGVGGFKPPRPIKDAVIQLVVMDLEGYLDRGASAGRVIASETTDGHSVTYEQSSGGGGARTAIPDQIMDVLKLYRRPWKITMPDSVVFEDPSAAIAGW